MFGSFLEGEGKEPHPSGVGELDCTINKDDA
jgi:hypothetical protein